MRVAIPELNALFQMWVDIPELIAFVKMYVLGSSTFILLGSGFQKHGDMSIVFHSFTGHVILCVVPMMFIATKHAILIGKICCACGKRRGNPR
jgi:hypothetical protein